MTGTSDKRPRKQRAANKVKDPNSAKSLSHPFPGGPAGQKQKARKARDAARIAARRKKAWKLLIERELTYEDIGKACGVSVYTAWHDIHNYLADLQRQQVHDAELLRAKAGARLNAIIASHMGKVSTQAGAATVMAATAQEAKLFGYGIERKDSYSPEQVLGLLKGITALFMEVVQDADMRRQFSLGLTRRAGTLVGEVAPEQTRTRVTAGEPASESDAGEEGGEE